MSLTRILSEEERNMLKQEILEDIRDFNENFGDSLVVQFKDFSTGEVVFNLYMKINEDDVIYFEPMLPSELPEKDVVIELDVEKFMDIIEYEKSGTLELESPPWDKKPRVSFVKGVTDNVKMYLMFRSLMSSAVVSPEDAEPSAKFFTRIFFERVMGDGEHPPDEEKPGEEIDEDVWEDKESLTGQAIKI